MDSSSIDYSDRVGSGGTAEVYRVKSSPDIVAKIYNDPRKANFHKVREIASRLKGSDPIGTLAVPLELVVGPSGPIGFTQRYFPKSDYLELDHWIEGALKKQRSIHQCSLSFRIQILHTLASTIARLHDRHIAIVDLKPSNVLVERRSGSIALVDCDAFCVLSEEDRILFPAQEVTTGYCSGDALRKGKLPSELSYEQDSFAFAVIAFQLLNNGIHPYQGIVKSADGEFNLDGLTKAGDYPYGRIQPAAVSPLRVSIHDTFPDILREAFDRSFVPNRRRINITQWASLFSEIIDKTLLEKCSDNTALGLHWKFKNHRCGDCRYSELVGAPRKTKSPTPPKPPNTGGGTIPPPSPPSPATGSFSVTSIVIAAAILLVMLAFALQANNTKRSEISISTAPSPGQVNEGTNATSPPLDINRQPDPVTQLTDRAVCISALNITKTGWEGREYYVKYVAEARRRNLSLYQCKLLVGANSATTSTPRVLNGPLHSCDIVGSDVAVYRKVSLNECMARCNSVSLCRALVYNKWNSSCILKSSASPRIMEVAADCYAAAPLTGYDDAGFEWAYAKLRNKKFHNIEVIATRNARDLDHCETLCKDNDMCFAANFNKIQYECTLIRTVDSAAHRDPEYDAVYVHTKR